MPILPEALPRRGNFLSRLVGRFVLKLLRWEICGDPPSKEKFVAIAAPHTSNWDFVIGMAVIVGMGLDVHWLGKHTIFRPPFGPFFCWLGGIPVNRDAHVGVVEQTVQLFQNHSKMILGLSPEGTRRKVEKWKTGFYHIAEKAQVPILLVALDYSCRAVRFGPLLFPSGDLEKDMEKIRAFYADVKGKRPELFNLGS